VRRQVLGISAAQADRLLAPHKAGTRRGRCGTKPGGLLKHQIPIRTDNWDVTMPGYLEATRDVEALLPFAILGFDCDNGSEFLNWHLVSYFDQREKKVGFTRSRPYHKNDNGHVEQKNWTHVRQLLGYDRLQDPELRQEINALYRDIWEPFHNYFCPSAKLLSKDRHGAKIKRRHDRPMTPCDRLLASPDVSEATKKKLRQTRAALHPFDLQRQLDAALRPILQRALRSSRPTGSLLSAPVAATPPIETITTVS
jgi:hypothetical protein